MIDRPTRFEPSRPLTAEIRIAAGNHHAFWRTQPLILVLTAVIALIAFLVVIAGFIQRSLWMRQVGYADIFWTILSVRWGRFGVAATIFPILPISGHIILR